MSEVVRWVESGAGVRSLVPEAHAWAVSPDDAYIAWTEHRRDHVVHVTEVSSWRTVASLPGSPTAALRWTSPSTLLTLRRAHHDATLHAYAIPDGGELAKSRLADAGKQRGEFDASADGRVMLVGALTRDGWLGGRASPPAVYVVRGELGDDVTRVDPFDLGRDRGPSWRDRSGGACWDARGRLLTLTHPQPRTALLARRDAVLVPPENLAEVPLHGASPQRLSLHVSPRASLALASWRVPLNDVGDAARRLAIVSLP